MGQSVQKIKIARENVICFLQCLDFVINQKKSALSSMQNKEFLGLLVHSENAIETDRGKSSKRFNLLQNNFSQSRDIHFRIGKIIKPSIFLNTSSIFSSTAVSIFTTIASLSPGKENVIK